MTESELYIRLVRPLAYSWGAFCTRIDAPHVPDVYIAKNNFAFWLELKVVEPKTRGVLKPSWRPGQLAWAKHNRLRGNKNIFLGLGYKGSLYLLRPREDYVEQDILKEHEKIFTFLKNSLKNTKKA